MCTWKLSLITVGQRSSADLANPCAACCLQCCAASHPAVHYVWDAQVCDVHGGERGRAEAAHLLKVPQGALLRAALPAGGVGRPPCRVQAAAGAHVRWALGLVRTIRYLVQVFAP